MNLPLAFEIIDTALYFKKNRLLICGDIHIGYEEALNKQGILVPRNSFAELMKRTETLLKKTQPEMIIILGDLKHEFGTISETEWRHTVRFLTLLQEYAKKILLIKGNHDNILEPIARTKNLEIAEEYVINGMLFIHGNKIRERANDKKIKTIVIGHEHPAVTVTYWPRRETYKALLVGTWKTKKLIVVPSFTTLTEGTDVLKERLISPYLNRKKILDFDCYILADKAYYFGKVKNMKMKK
jgi:putative SbcD/Mre11-related phosphoesterase